MLIHQSSGIHPSEITPHRVYARRREFMQATGALSLSWALGSYSPRSDAQPAKLNGFTRSSLSVDEPLTPYKDVVGYTRFRELEENIQANSAKLAVRPWTVMVGGEVAKPRTFDIDDLLKLAPLEERVYRMRCVDGWSMVIPYIGYSLSEIIRRVEPTGNAKFVEFTSIHDPQRLPGQREIDYVSWPYVEGLRLDEAMHPLTLVALGLYGELLPKPNGAPITIKAPWKYGIKSPKSIVRIRLTREQPLTIWVKHYPKLHSFWSNVNPDIATIRWSQARERRIGEGGFFRPRRQTLMFNGYGEHVARLYSGMDPKLMY